MMRWFSMLTLALLSLAEPAFGEEAGGQAGLPVDQGLLERAIGEEEVDAEEKQQAVLRLTERERTMYADLAALEDQVAAVRLKVFAKETELERLERQASTIDEQLAELSRTLTEAEGRFGALLRSLWPLHVRRQAGIASTDSADSVWTEADRLFAWTEAVAHQVQREADAVQTQRDEVQAKKAALNKARQAASDQLQRVNAAKDELLPAKLELLKGIRGVRAELLVREQELDMALAALEDLRYRLQSVEKRPFGEQKGMLALPVDGKKMPRGKKERPSLRLKTTQGRPVEAVYWGKVVHNDILRGYGRVVIISHGDNYRTLYAFLAESDAIPGRLVEKGEIIGRTGFYPLAKGPGLYFELRYGENAVSPEPWFAK